MDHNKPGETTSADYRLELHTCTRDGSTPSIMKVCLVSILSWVVVASVESVTSGRFPGDNADTRSGVCVLSRGILHQAKDRIVVANVEDAQISDAFVC